MKERRSGKDRRDHRRRKTLKEKVSQMREEFSKDDLARELGISREAVERMLGEIN